ncbi:MAG: C_GCAxxG_C_C family protein [Lachnospiraceae bacterium]|nr:C_GCAxxG_C_C family protein [Lachnospiraceae bacterium]
MMDSRVEQAVATFESGYTCAQSVFATYADLFGMEKEMALKLASPMGGGIGRMREVCGVVSAMALLAGLKKGNTDPANEEGKEQIYLLTRQMAEKFKEKHGTIICRELLGIQGMEESAKPSLRTEEYYSKRPCSRLVATAAGIIEEMLLADTF